MGFCGLPTWRPNGACRTRAYETGRGPMRHWTQRRGVPGQILQRADWTTFRSHPQPSGHAVLAAEYVPTCWRRPTRCGPERRKPHPCATTRRVSRRMFQYVFRRVFRSHESPHTATPSEKVSAIAPLGDFVSAARSTVCESCLFGDVPLLAAAATFWSAAGRSPESSRASCVA